MTQPEFNGPEQIWECDGSLRDVYLHGTTLKDWEAFIAFASQHPHQFTQDSDPRPLPTFAEILELRNQFALTLTLFTGKVYINCHFFGFDHIELDIDPREVLGPMEHRQVLDFIEALAHRVGRTATITLENAPQHVLVSYDPAQRRWFRLGKAAFE